MALNSVAVSRLSQTWEVSGKWLLTWVAFIFSRKKIWPYDFICKYVKLLICLSSNIARKRYREIKSFVNNGPLWKHLLNYFFKLYLLLLCRQKLPSKFRKIYEEFEGILVRTFHFITPLYKFILTLYVEKAPFISGGSFSSQVKQLIASTVKAEYNTWICFF